MLKSHRHPGVIEKVKYSVRIVKTDIISGLPATTARDLMRYLEAPHPSEDLTHWIEQERLHTTLMGLEKEGFIARHFEDESAISGGSQPCAEMRWAAPDSAGRSRGRPPSASSAAVIQRAEEYNADPSHLFEITELVVFGSYLDPEVTSLW